MSLSIVTGFIIIPIWNILIFLQYFNDKFIINKKLI